MTSTEEQVRRQLAQLIGLKLSIARRAANMRVLHFGRVTVDRSRRRSWGEFALHLQCPWRIEGPGGVVTGHSDLWDPAGAGEDIDWDTWDYDKDGNLQDRRIAELLGGACPVTGSSANSGERLVVEGIDVDGYGGAVLALSDGYRLVIFPSGSQGEDWRLFRPSSSDDHFVVSGGRVEGSSGSGARYDRSE